MAAASGFVRSAGLLSGMTLISRVLGLVREGVCAHLFGVGVVWDAFVYAFCIPNLSRRMFGEGALSSAFVPLLADRTARQDMTGAARLTGAVFCRLGAWLGAASILGAAVLLAIDAVRPNLTLQLTAIMLPYMPLICCVALLAGAQNTLGRFAIPAIMPILFNTVLIVAVLWLSRRPQSDPETLVRWLAVTVIVAGLGQLVLQWIALCGAGLVPRLNWSAETQDLQRLRHTMAPMILGLSVVQLNTLGDLTVAGLFVTGGGGPSSLTYATRLYQLPVGLFGAALATALFPLLAHLASQRDGTGFADAMERGVRLALFVGLPASIGLWAIDLPLTRAVFEHGAFTRTDTIRVAGVLGGYAAGVWAYILQQVLVRGYYAVGDTRTPVRIAMGMVLLNLALNLVLVQALAEAGIALASAATAALQVVLLLRRLPGRSRRFAGELIGSMARISVASAAMAWIVVMLGAATASHNALLQLTLQVTTGALVYLAIVRALRCPELSELWPGVGS